jgi:hypothetical protein
LFVRKGYEANGLKYRKQSISPLHLYFVSFPAYQNAPAQIIF